MPNKDGHRRFGNTRKLPSGRYQARYLGPDGITRTAPRTFPTKRDAEQWLTVTEGEIITGTWRAPETGDVPLGPFAEKWVAERGVAPRTRELYAGLLANHIGPFLGNRPLKSITRATVRTWLKSLRDSGRSATTTAKAYRLLRAVLTTATDDGLIRDNPCRVKGADREAAPERPVATVAQVYRLAGAVPARFRLLVLLAAFTGLRWGELGALRRSDLDRDTRTVRVTRSLAQLSSGELVFGPPKSHAGERVVAYPAALDNEVRDHLADFVEPGHGSLVFTGSKGAPLRGSSFYRAVKWRERLAVAGLPGHFHFHDLRHTGNTLAAATGASTRELMARMGHSSVRAAMVYQHASSERDQEIANALNDRITAASRRAELAAADSDDRRDDDGDEGTAGVLAKVS